MAGNKQPFHSKTVNTTVGGGEPSDQIEEIWEDAGIDDDQLREDREPPAGNASEEDWREYRRSQGYSDAELEGKSRNELRDDF